MRARRALLYTPGWDLHKIEKAATLNVDCNCLDIEDGVAWKRKAEARLVIAQALQQVDFGRAERLVRINALDSGLAQDDLDSVLPAKPDGIVIPKVTEPDQIQWVSQQIAAAERAHGWETGSIRLIIIVERARAILNLPQLAQADPRLEALIFGADDLAVNLGATRTRAAWEVFYARSAMVTCAAAFELQAIDIVYVNFRDLEGLQQEARQGAELGYTGKQIIHPLQVAPVQAAFTPSQPALVRAQRIVEAYTRHAAAGVGAFEMDGEMIDMPIVKAAERVLARALAAGAGEQPD